MPGATLTPNLLPQYQGLKIGRLIDGDERQRCWKYPNLKPLQNLATQMSVNSLKKLVKGKRDFVGSLSLNLSREFVLGLFLHMKNLSLDVGFERFGK